MSDALRVLMVDSEPEWRGGQGQVVLLMKGLREHGVDVSLAAPPDSPLFRRAADLAIRRHAWRPRALFPFGVIDLRRILTSHAYDIVHAHASHAHSGAAAARMRIWPQPKLVVSRRVNVAVKSGPAARWKYRRAVDAYIAISESVRTALVAGGVDAASVFVVPSGIDLDKFAAIRDTADTRREFGFPPDAPLVGTVGALTAEKAPGDFITAARRVLAERADARFLVVGDGPLRGELERAASAFGISERVTFTGFRADALDLLAMLDVFVMCSLSEGLGTSILDAQAAGVPVVATRTGGIPEIVEDGVSGVLVSPRSPQLLGAAIVRMLIDGALRDSCRNAARERIGGYDYRNTVYKTLDVYHRLCDKSHLPLEKE
jgi:glycosyltransferase involved in cell wall biosynthesis